MSLSQWCGKSRESAFAGRLRKSSINRTRKVMELRLVDFQLQFSPLVLPFKYSFSNFQSREFRSFFFCHCLTYCVNLICGLQVVDHFFSESGAFSSGGQFLARCPCFLHLKHAPFFNQIHVGVLHYCICIFAVGLGASAHDGGCRAILNCQWIAFSYHPSIFVGTSSEGGFFFVKKAVSLEQLNHADVV